MKKILQIGESVLRKQAKEVPVSDISSIEIQKIIKEMDEALSREDDGVAIAAPQIGYSKRIFIVSNKVSEEKDSKKTKQKIFINPRIKNLSKKKVPMSEGCLSVRWKYGQVERSVKATIEAYDENGQRFQRGASGLLSQIFQHEVDHLNGILFVDKAEDLAEYRPEDIKNKD